MFDPARMQLYNVKGGRGGEHMRQTALVTALRERMAEVLVIQQGACGSCRQKCGLANEQKEVRLRVLNESAARVGDRVLIDLPDEQVLQAAAWVYMWPLVLLFLGVALGGQLFDSEVYSLLLGLAGLSLALASIKFVLEPRIKNSRKYVPTIIGFVDNDDYKERV